MNNLIEYDLGFNNKEKQKINKIYNQGDIIISYPGPNNEVNQINITKSLYNENKIKPKSKSIDTHKKLTNRDAGYKTIKQQVEEMYNQIQKEIGEMKGDEDTKKNIGYILRDAFTDEELLNNEKFGPNPLINLENYLNPKTNKKIIKPYIPDPQTNNQKINYNNQKTKDKNKIKTHMKNNYISNQDKPKEVNLQKIIDMWRENEKIVKNINLLYNRFLREEKIREENKIKKELLKKSKKKSKSKSKSKEKNVLNVEENAKINNETKLIKDNNNENRVNNEEEEDKKDKYINVKVNDEKKEEEKFEKTSNKIKKNCINDKKDFIKIVDISKDQKYIEAKKYIKKSKENCDKTNDMILEINHKIREDKKSIGNSDYKVIKKPKEELENKVNQIIEKVKTGINFSLNYENKINK